MTAEEIIEILETLPKDAVVEFTYDSGLASIYAVRFKEYDGYSAIFEGHK